MELSQEAIRAFQGTVWHYYAHHRRYFVWRFVEDPYRVLVSEIMLQQTQTSRVMQKYPAFIEQFPTIEHLARSSLATVITGWQGLGYNRRAIALHKIANLVCTVYNSKIPHDVQILQTFPGIGPNTAGSLVAFAFNLPSVFIETNIRTVFIHHFFPHQIKIKDDELYSLVAQVLDVSKPREWYYALMDYGVMLKQTIGNPNIRSAHYARQSTFKGSHREMRGIILRLLSQHSLIGKTTLSTLIDRSSADIEKALHELHKEGFIVITEDHITLA